MTVTGFCYVSTTRRLILRGYGLLFTHCLFVNYSAAVVYFVAIIIIKNFLIIC